MTEGFTPALTKALGEQAAQLRRIRRCSELEAWQAIRTTAGENLHDSVGTPDEFYWRAAVEVAERQLVASNDPRWSA